uniref:PWWP domain containing 2A n=1 Tax=Tetraodon nigroviridis TaxID=99883 RepID=H3CQE0_TETNG
PEPVGAEALPRGGRHVRRRRDHGASVGGGPPRPGARLRPEPPGPGGAAEPRSPAEPGPGLVPDLGPQPVASVQDLSPGTEVRVSLDHVIDDALVVSFCVGEKVFSGVLMDVSKRFGPYGIPITVFPRRDDRSRPQVSVPSPPLAAEEDPAKGEEAALGPASPPHPRSWSSKPPPLFQEGAPYPPPLLIRDTYNQALPQPLPRKIKRPKRRYRYEEPTSIMNAIKLRPRQVLCDKCKGVVASGGHREARRGAVDLRAEEASRRRRQPEGPIPSELKRLRNDDKGARGAADRRSSPAAPPSRRVLRGVSSSSSSSSPASSSSSSHMCLKKALAKGSAVDRSKAQQVLKNHKQDQNKAVTRAASMKSHNQKVHFTRRLGGAAVGSGSHTPLPPRVRLKPQRYRTDDS